MMLSGKRVVVCEDETITVMYLRHLLRQAGMFVVGTARTGEEAIETVLHSRPDLVIMDVRMPSMDGLEALQHIRAEYLVCTVVLSAYNDREHRARARELGVCAYLVKPLDGPVLLRQLEEAVICFNADTMPVRISERGR